MESTFLMFALVTMRWKGMKMIQKSLGFISEMRKLDMVIQDNE